MSVYERATEVVTEELHAQRYSNLIITMRAEVIVRRLAEEGLLIMDPLPDEDESADLDAVDETFEEGLAWRRDDEQAYLDGMEES